MRARINDEASIRRTLYRLTSPTGSLAASVLCALLLLSGCGDDEGGQQAPLPKASGSDSLAPILDIASQEAQTSSDPAELTSLNDNVDFASVQVGDSLQYPVILQNDGSQDLTIESIQLGGEEAIFSLGGACQEGTDLGPERSSCRLEVTFAPREPRAYSTRIIVTHSAEGSPLILNLEGTGQAPAPPPVVTPYVPSELEINAARMLQQRRTARLQVITPNVTLDNDFVIEDADYSQLGYEKTVSTYPVNRERLITSDRYIPAVLENTINSELSEGRCIGVVENHVYSSEGSNILIPAGSRIIGRYSSLSRGGQQRLEVIWYRLLRPDGVNIDIQSQGADVMGRLGLVGHVDKRYFDRFAMPLLISSLGIAAEYAVNPSEVTTTTRATESGDFLGTTTNETVSRENLAVRQFSSELLDISRQIIRDNIDVAPIITIPAGTRFLVIPTRDIELKRPGLMTAAGPMYDLVAQARNLINTLQRGELDAASLRLAEVMASAAKAGQVNEVSGLGNNPYTAPAVTTGIDSYGSPTDPNLSPTQIAPR